MHKVHTLNVDVRNRLSAGEVLVGETANKNLNDFVAKVVELAPESVYEVGFELGQRLANFHYYGLKNLGGCEFDLLCGTYGQNHFKLYDIQDLYVEYFNSMEEVDPKKSCDLMVFYQHRPSKEVVDKLSKKCKRMLFWMSIGHWEVFTPANNTEDKGKGDKYEGVDFLGAVNHTDPGLNGVLEGLGINIPIDENVIESVTFDGAKRWIPSITPEQKEFIEQSFPSKEVADEIMKDIKNDLEAENGE